MDDRQILALAKRDKYLSKKQCFAITEAKFPDIMPQNSIFFILIKSKKSLIKRGKFRYQIGHWVLATCLQKSKKAKNSIEICYIDPYGVIYPKEIGKKLRNSARVYKVDVFVSRAKIQGYSSICGPLCSIIALLRARDFSYQQIFRKKLIKDVRVMAEVIPDIISSLLPKGHKKLLRFSLDFL